ncbi:hypothetical protein O181_007120 [Austropuccinia psidii MF-1]|uniref:Uncharacterized protein n=1 Tax=Austropuccinia psidii MF-1 TaxID=1389203 RepID=A0A9Q3BLR6_9BASI|nr:hypothetical protein [Austropuccinia psidii MF-1]
MKVKISLQNRISLVHIPAMNQSCLKSIFANKLKTSFAFNLVSCKSHYLRHRSWCSSPEDHLELVASLSGAIALISQARASSFYGAVGQPRSLKWCPTCGAQTHAR